jgi:hypothetical protein
MLGGAVPSGGAMPAAGATPGPAGAADRLVPVGPGPESNGADEEIDLETAEPGDLAPAGPASTGGSALLASARELLDAAEAWRGRPVVPV